MTVKKELYIPVNVPEREDFISGFGTKELGITGIALLFSIVTAVIVFMQTGGAFWAVGTAGAIVAVTIILVRRDHFDESIIDKLHFVKLYRRAQKRFEYEYYNIYEGKADSGSEK